MHSLCPAESGSLVRGEASESKGCFMSLVRNDADLMMIDARGPAGRAGSGDLRWVLVAFLGLASTRETKTECKMCEIDLTAS